MLHKLLITAQREENVVRVRTLFHVSQSIYVITANGMLEVFLNEENMKKRVYKMYISSALMIIIICIKQNNI